jgi:hypothetical protein
LFRPCRDDSGGAGPFLLKGWLNSSSSGSGCMVPGRGPVIFAERLDGFCSVSCCPEPEECIWPRVGVYPGKQ